MENEIWKDIKGYEEKYKISSFGRVYSLTRNKFLKPYKDSKGYYVIGLCKNGNREIRLISRLVALNFIDNPNNLPCVNHIDGIRTNNDVTNLEWCSQRYNILHAHELGLIKPKNKLSKFKYVTWHKHTKRWISQIKNHNKNIFGGSFKNEEEAHLRSLELQIKYRTC
jgi:hypothetical protein